MKNLLIILIAIFIIGCNTNEKCTLQTSILDRFRTDIPKFKLDKLQSISVNDSTTVMFIHYTFNSDTTLSLIAVNINTKICNIVSIRKWVDPNKIQ